MMLNLTIHHLLLAYNLNSPLLSDHKVISIKDSSFSCFSFPVIFNSLDLHVMNSKFSKFLSNAICIDKVDAIYRNQNFIGQRPELRDSNVYIDTCVFRDCAAPSSIGHGGAIAAAGSILQINNSAFTACYSANIRTNGGAVYSTCLTNSFNSVCALECYASEAGQFFYLSNPSSTDTLNYVSLSACGKNEYESGSGSTYISGWTVVINNVNSTGNLVAKDGGGLTIFGNKQATNDPTVVTVSFCYFIQDFGRSIINSIGSEVVRMTNANFVSNTVTNAIVYTASVSLELYSCYFQQNSGTIAITGKPDDPIKISNSFIDVENWGNATLSNNAVVVTSIPAIQFFQSAICYGYIPRTPAQTLAPGQTPYPTETQIVTDFFSLSEIETEFTEEYDNFSDMTPEVIYKFGDGYIAAIVFCVLEALAIIALAIILAICLIRAKKKLDQYDKAMRQQEGEDNDNVSNMNETKDEKDKEMNLEEIPPNSSFRGTKTPQRSGTFDDDETTSARQTGRKTFYPSNSNSQIPASRDNADEQQTPHHRRRRVRKTPSNPYESDIPLSNSTRTNTPPHPPTPPPASEEDPNISSQAHRRRRKRHYAPGEGDDQSPLMSQKATRDHMTFSSDPL